jgi:hypothetical protein
LLARSGSGIIVHIHLHLDPPLPIGVCLFLGGTLFIYPSTPILTYWPKVSFQGAWKIKILPSRSVTREESPGICQLDLASPADLFVGRPGL